jgi:hypothetical protein
MSPSAALAAARTKYFGAKVKIDGPLESASPGQLATYINWRMAKKDLQGRYRAVTPVMQSRLTEGYERRIGTVIAIQVSDRSSSGPFPAPHEETDLGPRLNFLVKFDNGVIALCTCPLKSVDGNFSVVSPPARPPK